MLTVGASSLPPQPASVKSTGTAVEASLFRKIFAIIVFPFVRTVVLVTARTVAALSRWVSAAAAAMPWALRYALVLFAQALPDR
jgi:hypothetical protein